jgi:hypothetical protein
MTNLIILISITNLILVIILFLFFIPYDTYFLFSIFGRKIFIYDGFDSRKDLNLLNMFDRYLYLFFMITYFNIYMLRFVIEEYLIFTNIVIFYGK